MRASASSNWKSSNWKSGKSEWFARALLAMAAAAAIPVTLSAKHTIADPNCAGRRRRWRARKGRSLDETDDR